MRIELTGYTEAITEFVASAALIGEWPACQQDLIRAVTEQPDWILKLPCLSCLAVGGYDKDAIPVSAAWVALHRAAEILDAIQDDQPSPLDETMSPAGAVNWAVGLISAAFDMLGNGGWPQEATRRVVEIVAGAGFTSAFGQSLDLAGGYEGMTVAQALERYWEMVIAKTGSQMRAATAGGAAVGTDCLERIEALTEFGTCLGVIVQVLDDCADVLAGTETCEYEISLPILLLSAQQEGTDGAVVLPGHVLPEVFQEAGIPAVIADALLEWRNRAVDSLECLLPSEAREMLKGILDETLELA